MPVYSSAFLRIGIVPRHSALIAGVHAGTAFDAVLKLKNDTPIVVILVAFCGADVRRAVVRTNRIADSSFD
jgi:hypothetical protein